VSKRVLKNPARCTPGLTCKSRRDLLHFGHCARGEDRSHDCINHLTANKIILILIGSLQESSQIPDRDKATAGARTTELFGFMVLVIVSF
jgi:hypothetical protein